MMFYDPSGSKVISAGEDSLDEESFWEKKEDYRSAINDFQTVMKSPDFFLDTSSSKLHIPPMDRDVMAMTTYYQEIELVLNNLCGKILIVGLIGQLISSNDDVLFKILPTQVAERFCFIYKKEMAKRHGKHYREIAKEFSDLFKANRKFFGPRPATHKQLTLINSPVESELVELNAIISQNRCLRKLVQQVKLPNTSFARQLEAGVRRLMDAAKEDLIVTAKKRCETIMNLREAQTVMKDMKIRIKLCNERLHENKTKANAKIEDIERKIDEMKEALELVKVEKLDTQYQIVEKNHKDMGLDTHNSLQKQILLAEEAIATEKEHDHLVVDHISEETTKRVLMRKTQRRLETLMTMCDNELFEKQAEYDGLLERSNSIDKKYNQLYAENRRLRTSYEDCMSNIKRFSVDLSEKGTPSKATENNNRISELTRITNYSAATLQFDISSLKDW